MTTLTHYRGCAVIVRDRLENLEAFVLGSLHTCLGLVRLKMFKRRYDSDRDRGCVGLISTPPVSENVGMKNLKEAMAGAAFLLGPYVNRGPERERNLLGFRGD